MSAAARGTSRRGLSILLSALATPTLRGLVLLVVSLAPLALAVRVGALFIPGVVLPLVVYTVLVADRVRAPGGAGIGAQRDHPRTFPVGRATDVVVRVRADGDATAVVRDEHPVDVPASRELMHTRLRRGEETALTYTLTPPARGRRTFGDIVVRTEGPLGLATRQTAVHPGDDAVEVDPDLSAVRAYEALVRRGQLAEMGLRTVRSRGEGTEFERIRDAVPDDPLRAINWKATARTGRVMATELIPERAQPVVVCIDHGRLMGVGAGALTKLDHAMSAALLLAHVALRTGDRVGVMAFAEDVSVALPARAGRVQLGAMFEALRPLQASSLEADYDEALGFLSRWQRRRALMAIFTDVLDPDQGRSLIAQCVRLQRRHLPLVITVRDPALDAAARQRPGDVQEAYSRAVAGRLLAERADVLRTLRRSGVETLDADARLLSPRLVNRYLELKRRARL